MQNEYFDGAAALMFVTLICLVATLVSTSLTGLFLVAMFGIPAVISAVIGEIKRWK